MHLEKPSGGLALVQWLLENIIVCARQAVGELQKINRRKKAGAERVGGEGRKYWLAPPPPPPEEAE